MANDITGIPPSALAMTSSPDFTRWRKISIGTVTHPNQPTRKYLAGGLKLTDDEKRKMSMTISVLQAASVSDNSRENRIERFAVLAKMLMGYPMANSSAEVAKARSEMYMDALDDIPAWAVGDAVKRWNRGEAGEQNYTFAPPPAVLRAKCLGLLAEIKKSAEMVEDLLGAIPIEDAVNPAPRAPVNQLIPLLKAMRGK